MPALFYIFKISKKIGNKLSRFFLILATGGFSTAVSAGISVSPLSAILNLNEGRSHMLTVINTDKVNPIAIRVRAAQWQLDSEGHDVRNPTDDLVLFPIQFILPAGSRRSIRVAPREHLAPEVERSYRVFVQEVPIDLLGENQVISGVRLITSYATAFYVAPSLALSKLTIEGSSKDQHQLSFTLVNNGNAHTHLHKLSITVLQDGKEHLIEDPEVLKGIYNENILAHSRRNFTFSWPDSIRSVINLQAPIKFRLEVNCESCGGSTIVLEYSIP